MVEKKYLGIDYGTKLGGSTAICFEESGSLQIIQSVKKMDSDLFITQAIGRLLPDVVYIDAPLSLPGAYFGKGEDYFYRKGDREVRAMSPMFIGGLTARAIQLKEQLTKTNPNLIIYETYPGYLARSILGLKNQYLKKTKEVEPFLHLLEEYLPLEIASRPTIGIR